MWNAMMIWLFRENVSIASKAFSVSCVFVNITRQITNSFSAIFPKHTHFSFKVLRNLCDDHNVTLICWKEWTLKNLFLFSMYKNSELQLDLCLIFSTFYSAGGFVTQMESRRIIMLQAKRFNIWKIRGKKIRKK